MTTGEKARRKGIERHQEHRIYKNQWMEEWERERNQTDVCTCVCWGPELMTCLSQVIKEKQVWNKEKGWVWFLSHVSLKGSAVVVGSSGLPHKEHVQRLMSTDGGKCGQLEKAMNMEQELLEPQLFPLINCVKIWKLKRRKYGNSGSCQLFLC